MKDDELLAKLSPDREESVGSELSKVCYTLLGMVKFDLTEKGRKLAEKVISKGS